jgi:hypothetical protein
MRTSLVAVSVPVSRASHSFSISLLLCDALHEPRNGNRRPGVLGVGVGELFYYRKAVSVAVRCRRRSKSLSRGDCAAQVSIDVSLYKLDGC